MEMGASDAFWGHLFTGRTAGTNFVIGEDALDSIYNGFGFPAFLKVSIGQSYEARRIEAMMDRPTLVLPDRSERRLPRKRRKPKLSKKAAQRKKAYAGRQARLRNQKRR